MPQGKAVFAYKNPKQAGAYLVLRVHELPNGIVEVQMQSVGADEAIDHRSFVKMIEKHDDYNNLDKWLPKEEFTKQYKNEVLGKVVGLPEEKVE